MSNSSAGGPSPSTSAQFSQTSQPSSPEKTEGKAFTRKTSRLDSVKKMLGIKTKHSTKSKPKALSNYQVSHTPAKPQVNLTRIHAQAGLEIWTDNPKNITVKPYQGPPLNLKKLGKMGNVILLPPGNWQISPSGKVTPFALPFPGPLGQNPPGQMVQHFTGHPQNPLTQQPAAPIASAYKDHGLRKLINQSRVSERFHDVELSSQRFRKKAASVIEAYQNGTSRHSQANANLKSQHLTQIASVLDHHKSEQAKFLPSNAEEIKAQAQSQIDSLEQGMQAIAEIANSGRAHYSKEDFKALQTLSKEMDAERALLVQVMDDPETAQLAGTVSWGEATEFKRLGYPAHPGLSDEFTTLTDATLVKPAEQFGSGKLHSVQKLTFAGAEENDPPMEYLFKADDAKDNSRYEKVVGKVDILPAVNDGDSY